MKLKKTFEFKKNVKINIFYKNLNPIHPPQKAAFINHRLLNNCKMFLNSHHIHTKK